MGLLGLGLIYLDQINSCHETDIHELLGVRAETWNLDPKYPAEVHELRAWSTLRV